MSKKRIKKTKVEIAKIKKSIQYEKDLKAVKRCLLNIFFNYFVMQDAIDELVEIKGFRLYHQEVKKKGNLFIESLKRKVDMNANLFGEEHYKEMQYQIGLIERISDIVTSSYIQKPEEFLSELEVLVDKYKVDKNDSSQS